VRGRNSNSRCGTTVGQNMAKDEETLSMAERTVAVQASALTLLKWRISVGSKGRMMDISRCVRMD